MIEFKNVCAVILSCIGIVFIIFFAATIIKNGIDLFWRNNKK
jgi:hypothetical protein